MNKCLFTLFVENGKRFYFSPSCTSFIQVKMFSSSVHTDSHQLLSKKKKVKKSDFFNRKGWRLFTSPAEEFTRSSEKIVFVHIKSDVPL